MKLYQYPIGTFFYNNCPYVRSLFSYQWEDTVFPPIDELNPLLNSNSACCRPEFYYRNSNMSSLNLSNTVINLMNDLRKLWEQHDVWTRSTIMSIIFNLPDVDFVTNRLLRNPVDFGNALEPFYGSSIALKFSDLLKDHLVIAAELVKAAKAGNKQSADAIEKRWYDNADQIAIFLSQINHYWSQEEWKVMLHQHLALVKSEAVNILTKNYAAGIAVYDELENQSLGMADMMAEGITKQFPNKFTE